MVVVTDFEYSYKGLTQWVLWWEQQGWKCCTWAIEHLDLVRRKN